jgi:transcriptional regulator with XRE-family HTH domain
VEKPSFGAVLKQAREVRELSAIDAARAARISPAYLSKLETTRSSSPRRMSSSSSARRWQFLALS